MREIKLRLLLTFLLTCGWALAQKAEVQTITPSVNPFLPQRVYMAGDLISVYGKNLATSTAQVNFKERTTTLAGVSIYYIYDYHQCPEMLRDRDSRDASKVLACGVPLELVYASPTQINAILPWSGDPSGRLARETSGDYYGFLALAKGDTAEIYLQRMYPDSDEWWNIYPIDVGIGAKPNFIVRGFVAPFIAVAQPHELSPEPADGLMPHAYITHADGSEITSEMPVVNGETITIWITGAGDMIPCESLLCVVDEKAEAMRPYVGFRYSDRGYYFQTQPEFIGSTPGFPWLQQIRTRISLCTEGQGANQPQALNGQLYFRHYDSWSGWTEAPGGYAVSLPFITTGQPEEGAPAYSYEQIKGLSLGRWVPGCLKY